MSANGLEAESDAESDWEEVQVPQEEKPLEITISVKEYRPTQKSVSAHRNCVV
jgi:hypothetical protein